MIEERPAHLPALVGEEQTTLDLALEFRSAPLRALPVLLATRETIRVNMTSLPVVLPLV